MVTIKSIFEEISGDVFAMTDLNQMKTFVVSYVEGKRIKDEDKKRIVIDVVKLDSVYAFHRYVCNSLLKYEGMGMNKINKKRKD
jgi:hypothetical protein